MMSISSKAGKRLAKARDELNRWREGGHVEGKASEDLKREYAEACIQVADELIAQGFHEMEGD